MKNNPKSLLRFIWFFVKEKLVWYLGVLFFTFAFSMLTCASSYALKLIIDVVEATNDPSLVGRDIFWPCVFFMGCYVSISISLRFRNICGRFFYPAVQRLMTTSLHKSLQKKQFHYFQDHLTGAVANRVIGLTRSSIELLELGVTSWFTLSLVVLYLIFLMLCSPWFTLAYCVWLMVFIPVTLWVSSYANDFSKGYAESQMTLAGCLVDSINNIYFVKLFGQYFHEEERIDRASGDTFTKNVRLTNYLIKLRLVLDFFVLLILFVNLFLLVYLYQYGLVTMGDFAFVITTTLDISWYIWEYFGEQFFRMIQEYGHAQQGFLLFKNPMYYKDIPNAKPLIVEHGKIEFKKMTYYYQESNKLFDDFDCVIKPGEKVGLVGYSGSGKTTLLHLLLRFLPAVGGDICIDGQSLSTVTMESVRENIAMIPQDTTLFHRSIYDNICYGDTKASRKDVIKAAKRAHAHDFIMQLPEGYDTVVGERGGKLSGGQCQRIAIARAFLKDAPVLLLDEATSSLDTVTEKAIYESLQELIQDRTTIVIAHRLSTIKSMDRIIVLDSGVVVEQGSHRALIAKKGYYANMWKHQSDQDMLDDSLPVEEGV
ncbi:MAG: ABC transporter ATP-binding protein [Pseudomonadota bacterium]|nr:ABC transporter ATP-binding protein [Pseudomonadota bacterium]